jgi:hypothetical protein
MQHTVRGSPGTAACYNKRDGRDEGGLATRRRSMDDTEVEGAG